ncbi:MAG: sigma-54 dependent transcriptional regulator [Candidatus Zixiibacteriota bacterium]
MTGRSCRTILVVDDDPRVLEMLAGLFSDDYEVILADSGEAAVAKSREGTEIAAVVMDIKMAGMDGLQAARRIREFRPVAPIIFHTGYPGEYDESDIDSSEHPFDYVQKGRSIPQLMRSVRNAVDSFNLRTERTELSESAASDYGIFATSSVMQEVFNTIRKIAASDNKVMILGETGTGKELVARAIHAHSRRKEKQFAILNCEEQASDLMAAELFGSLRGAYTSAFSDRVGLFEYADGGTVFLDEIGDLDPATQAKLLRVLETGEYQKIGSPELKRSNVRILCATHRDLAQLTKQGKFREDLYYRLKGVTISLPPLRERKEDIPLLVARFSGRFTVEQGLPPKLFDASAIDVCLGYDWPGNVRQLVDVVESLIVLCESEVVFGEDVAKLLNQGTMNGMGEARTLGLRVRNFERSLIVEALAASNQNVAAAAKTLGVDRSNLLKKIRLLQIPLPRRDQE